MFHEKSEPWVNDFKRCSGLLWKAFVCSGFVSLFAEDEVVGKAVRPVKRVRTRPFRPSNIIQGSDNWKPCASVSHTKRDRMRPLVDQTWRKEVHNRKERDRRWFAALNAFQMLIVYRSEITWSMFLFCSNCVLRRRIRLCCDELNLLVPFCYADTDKATTLQWTTAFLKYIQEIHGDCLKQVRSNMPPFWVYVGHVKCMYWFLKRIKLGFSSIKVLFGAARYTVTMVVSRY